MGNYDDEVVTYRVILSAPSGEDCLGEFNSLVKAIQLFDSMKVGLQPDEFIELVDNELNVIDTYQA